MRRLRAIDPRRLPVAVGVLLPILLLAGCAGTTSRPTASAEDVLPHAGPVETSPGPSAPSVDEAILAARARQAAGEKAQQDGDEKVARSEFEAALAVLQRAGADPRLDEVIAEINEDIHDLDTGGEPDQETAEGEAEEVEPAPIDELATTTPEISPGELEAERNRIAFGEGKFDIPMVVNDKVVAWVDFYTTRHRDKFEQGLVRSGRYLPMIQRVFAEAGLPKDLAYMAHVESAYKTNAFSRAKAKGIFQFISGTGRRYGLRTDYWVDERSDPEKATRAAAAYLKDLYGMFGDWYLALAAYNAGEGKIQRVVMRSGHTDFWDIAAKGMLKRETANYVPAILAATLISKDPARFGFSFEPAVPLEYDTIRVDGPVHLKVLARCAGTDLETLLLLNPAFRRRQVPPGSNEVRVPAGTAASTVAALGSVPAAERSEPVHHVRKGDTLASIARKYRVRTSAIRAANGMGKRSAVRPGEDLIIPGRTIDPADEADARPARSGSAIVYRVRRGDTLSSVARRYGTTPAAIASASGISPRAKLDVGQRLTIPGAGMADRDRRSAPHPKAESSRVVHTVKPGDTLSRIADRYRVTVDQICALNNLTPDAMIYPGLRLTIYGN